jgi:hypothetical protein
VKKNLEKKYFIKNRIKSWIGKFLTFTLGKPIRDGYYELIESNQSNDYREWTLKRGGDIIRMWMSNERVAVYLNEKPIKRIKYFSFIEFSDRIFVQFTY